MPDTTLPLFEFEGQPLRVHLDDAGEPWFVAKDAALALDYEWKGISTIGHVPAEWRRVYSVQTLQRGLQFMLTLSEPGLYFFVARSDKPRALPFQKWLAGEVLPALRRKGHYEMPGRSGSRPVDLDPAALRLRPALAGTHPRQRHAVRPPYGRLQHGRGGGHLLPLLRAGGQHAGADPSACGQGSRADPGLYAGVLPEQQGRQNHGRGRV